MAEIKSRSSSQRVKKPLSARLDMSHCSKPVNRPSSAQLRKPQEDLLAKEEEYKRLNAELEAKTAELVRQAEEVMREQNVMLSRPISSNLDIDTEDEEETFRNLNLLTPTTKQPSAKALTKDRGTSKVTTESRPLSGNRIKKASKTARTCPGDEVAVLEDFTLAKTISKIEGKLEEDGIPEDEEDDIMPSVGSEMTAEAQIRFLKAKLRVMQEEINRLAHECNKKDDENINLSTKVKELEEDRSRLQRTTNIQQTQIEKQRRLAEESNRRCEGLQQQVTALQKEIEGLKRTQKQTLTNHSATEVRLNRALEEAERSKMELNKIKQISKDSANQEQKKMELLKAENKKLEKQKAELMTGFKKQLKLIDILKRQKMHIEAAKLLSFTEEEFMKALDWGKS
uniref:Testis expressed 9 n=1 Tax=Lepisosteus oculatus TaxID=7918 RepID=W5N7P7_LEPOC|nr:PREDICTED: testis-expressed sequence 9 protein [Lepisosteus oculatus]